MQGRYVHKNCIYFFKSPGPKVQVNYCHHLAYVVCHLLSVICQLFTFQASSPKPLGQLEPNLQGMFLGWSSTKFLFFVPVGYSTWLPGPIIYSDWLRFQKPSSLKPLGELKPNGPRMIIGRSSTKFLCSMPMGNPRWPPPQDISWHCTLWENVEMPSFQKLQIWLKPNCTCTLISNDSFYLYKFKFINVVCNIFISIIYRCF